MSANNFSTLRRKLLRWYDQNKRDLPWRRTRDPYAIWVSEAMLQQTQVKTVLPFYQKFLRAFPSVEALHRAPLDRVLRVWSGLGYYRRAQNLKLAARQLVRDHDGTMPQEYDQLRALAGIGDYTAGAILSIAFEQRYAAVDGNVRRVLGRILNLADEIKLRRFATALVPRSRPGDFNQALMELGAIICLPKQPRCDPCPLAKVCTTQDGKRANRRPLGQSQVKYKDVTWPLAIVRHHGKVLLRRRADAGLLARLWEFPGGEVTRPDETTQQLRKELSVLALASSRPRLVAQIRHSITNRRIRAPIYLIDCPAAATIQLPNNRWRWFNARTVKKHAVSSMTVKAAEALHDYETRSV